MEKPRIFHGNITPDELADVLVAEYNRGNLRAQKLSVGKNTVVQISSRQEPSSGGQTSLSIAIRQIEDGISIQLGEQSWLGVAASLGKTAFWAWRNPWNLIYRLDDLAQDFEYLQLSDQVWEFIEDTAYTAGATFELSERLKRLECEYCHSANPVGASNCNSCGAPLGALQPLACKNCGFVNDKGVKVCSNCGKKL